MCIWKVERVTWICVLMVLVWAMACGPAATAPGSGDAETNPTGQAEQVAPGVGMLQSSSGVRAVRAQAATAIPEPTMTEAAPSPTPALTVAATSTPVPTEPSPTPWAASWTAPFWSIHSPDPDLFLAGPPVQFTCPDSHVMCSHEYHRNTTWLSENFPAAYFKMDSRVEITEVERIRQGDLFMVATACQAATTLIVDVEYQERTPPHRTVEQTETVQADVGYSETQFLFPPSAFSRTITISPVSGSANCWVGLRGPFTPEPLDQRSPKEMIWGEPVAFVEPTRTHRCPDEEPMCKYDKFYWNASWISGGYHAESGDVLHVATHCREATEVQVEERITWDIQDGNIHGSSKEYSYPAPAGYHEETIEVTAERYSKFAFRIDASEDHPCWIAKVDWEK